MTKREIEQEKQIQELKELLAQQEKQLVQQQKQLEHLQHLIDLFNREKFGSKTEKSKVIIPEDANQLSLFNEAEVEANPKTEEPSAVTVAEHSRKRKKKPNYADILADMPGKEVILDVPENERHCSQHPDGEIVQLGKELVRVEVKHIPARVEVIRYYQLSYKCVECSKEDHFTILKAQVPKPLFTNASIASPSLVASILYGKYEMALPLYRQEKEWAGIGIPLKRVNMANWILNVHQKYLCHIADHLQAALVQRSVVHADETPIQVHRETNRKNTTKSYMWCCCTSPLDEGPDIRIFKYYAGRKGIFAKDMLTGFNGTVMHDQYAGYNKLPNVVHAGCLVHMRREFVKLLPKEEELRAGTLAGQAILKLRPLFTIEKEIKELSIEERVKERKNRAKPLLDEFFAWLESALSKFPCSGDTAKAINYALHHKDTFYTYLDDGKLGIDNSVAENAIRPFVIGRKNWMFADSPKGAEASAAIYSIVETCKANGINSYKYFDYILAKMSNEDFLAHPEVLEEYMPWNQAVQSNCAITK